MATFEELFPEYAGAPPAEPFTPIQTGRVSAEMRQARGAARTALDVGAGRSPQEDLDDLMGRYKPRQQEADTEWADFGKTAIGGVGGLGQAAAGAGEYVSNYFAGDRNSPGEQMMGDLADTFGRGRRNSGEMAQDWFLSMTPEAQQRAMREITTLDPNKTIWQGGAGEFLSSIGLKMSNAAPSTLVTLLPGGLIMRAGLGKGAIAYLGASEGALSMGSIAANIADEIEQAPEAELMQSQRYQALRQSMGEQEARQALVREAQGYAPVIGGLAVGAISAVAGRYLEPVFTGKAGGMFSRAGRGAIAEGPLQEGPQSAAEQIAQNVAAQTFDGSRDTFEGVGEAAAQGSAIGAGMGGGFSAAFGRGPTPAAPPPEIGAANPSEPAPPTGPEPFGQVFQPQTPPAGGWRGGDIETGGLADVNTSGQRLIDAGPVNADIQAAMNARADKKMDDMFEQQGPNAGTPQQFMAKPWPAQQQEMNLPQATTALSTVPGQQSLPLTDRVRGVGRVPMEPMQAQPLVEDTSAPPGFSTAVEPPNLNGRRPTRADFIRMRNAQDTAGMVRDPRQMDMLSEQPQMADQPSAEPLGDLNAQLEDLADPDSPRLGVYLSAANMQQVGDVPAVGVPLADFDGKGGTLIAKNRAVAEELIAIRDEGNDMQQILGLATGAGIGKPAGASIAVQQRDEQGNVVRESLVASPEEADVLATEFDAPGREGVILSADMAIKRRDQRIAKEREQARTKGIVKTARRRVDDEPENIKTRAARVAVLQDQLKASEKNESDAPNRGARIKAAEKSKQIKRELEYIRSTTEEEMEMSAKPPRFKDSRASLEKEADESISKMDDEQVDELFREAVNVRTGRKFAERATRDESREVAEASASTTISPTGKTTEEYIADNPTRSQKLKFIAREKRALRRAQHGGMRTRTRPVTAKGGIRKGIGGAEDTAVRKSELRPHKALDLEPPREMSQPERAKHNARVRKTYSQLDTTMQAFTTKLEPLNEQLVKEGEVREDGGNPPHKARNAIYGRAYLNTLFRYGQMLQALHPRSSAGLNEVDRFLKLSKDLLATKGDAFLNELSKAMQAESEAQASAAIKVDPNTLKNMGTRRQRRALIAEDSKRRRISIAWAKRLHDVWHKDAKYNEHVAPLIQKLVGYVTRDTSLSGVPMERRGLGYIPTFNEMRKLRYALQDFKKTNNKELYKPLRDWFTEFGYKFDDAGDLVLAKNAAQFDYVQPTKVMARSREAMQGAPLNYNQKVALENRRRLNAVKDKERSRRNALTPAQRRREDMTLANRIERLRRSTMTIEQRKALEGLDRQSPLYLRLDAINQDLPSLRKAAETIADTMEGYGFQSTSGEIVLKSLSATLPANHPYQMLVRRLLNLDMKDVIVSWDGDMGNSFGEYSQTEDANGKWRHLRFNRRRYEELREQGKDPAAFMVHAVLHEMVHAATAGAIRNNPRVKAAMHAIMRHARISAREQNIDLTSHFNRDGEAVESYGFKDDIVEEFVAEAFTNSKFQDLLREIKIDQGVSVWQIMLNVVKRLLGLDSSVQADNVLDAVLATTDKLFTGELSTRGTDEALNIKDDSVRAHVGNFIDKTMQSSRVTRDIRERVKNTIEGNKEGGSRFLLSALTMEQIRDFYGNAFGGGRGPLSEYMKAFFQRNADNSANMELADKLSRRWTTLTEELGAEKSIALSRVMSESTLYGIHPDESITADKNKTVKSLEQRNRHAELAKQFKALPPELRTLYQDLKEYYADTFRKEVNLVTLNSLRAVLDGPFNYTEEDIERKKLNTQAGLKKEFGDRLSDTNRKIISRTAALPMEHVGPYFPLMRFGDYVVTAERTKESKTFADRKDAYTWANEQRENDPTLSVSSPMESDGGYTVTVREKEVRMAETPSEAEQNRLDMIEEYGAENVDREVQRKSKLYSSTAAIGSGSGLRSIIGKLDGNPAAQAAIKDFYLRSISDGAFRKREIKRAHRRGVNYDLQHRTFASYAKSAAYFMSQLRHGSKMADALISMDKFAKSVAKGEESSDISVVRMNDVIDEINTRDKLTHDPMEVSKIVRGGTELSQFMMLTSPSYWMINATQPYMVTLPWLAARSSIGEATAALATAQRLIASPIVQQMGESFGGAKALWSKAGAEKAFTVLEQVEEHIKKRGGARADEYISMLNKLKRDSIIDLSFVAELRDISEGQNTSAWQRVLDASRIMAHLTEVNNRIMTALAAYDLHRTKGQSVFESQEFAKQAVSLTQFNYSSGNAPRLFQARGPLGQMGPLIFQFMKYPQHMYALLIDNMRRAVYSGGLDRTRALKTLAGLFATHLAAGGIIGAMLQPIKWAIGLTLAAFGDDDEPYTVKNALSGETFDRMIREATADLMGNDLGEIVSAGLPRAAGIDLSNRMSLGTLYFVDLKTDTAETTIGSLAGSFGGPLVNLGMGAFRGANYMQEGQVAKGLEAFLPKMAKDIFKMIRYSNEGLTDATGKEIVGADKLSPWGLFAQSIGFQPSQVSESYAARAAIKDAQGHDQERRATLMRRYQNGSPQDRASLIREITEFNAANPAARISRSQLLKSVESFRKRERLSRRYGVVLQGDDVRYAEEGEIYNDDDE